MLLLSNSNTGLNQLNIINTQEKVKNNDVIRYGNENMKATKYKHIGSVTKASKIHTETYCITAQRV